MTIDSGMPIRGTPLPPTPTPSPLTHSCDLFIHDGRRFVRYYGYGVDDIYEVSKFLVKHSKFRTFDVYIGKGFVCVRGVRYL